MLFAPSLEEWIKDPPVVKIERNGQKITMLKSYVPNEKRITDFKIRDDDYWVTGFSKAGTTWVQEMVWCIGNDLDFEKSKSIPVTLKFPLLENEMCFQDGRFDEWETSSILFSETMESPRFIKTHLPWQLLPAEIRTGKVQPKIVYVYREPKDSIVSYYNCLNKLGRVKAPFEYLCEGILNDFLPYCPFWMHVNEFRRRKNLPNLLVLSYEEIKADIDTAVRKTAKFLNKSFTDEQFEALKNHLSLDSMKQNKSVSIRLVMGEEKEFLGKGQIGLYKEYMKPEMITRFDEWTKNNQEIGEEITAYDKE